MDGAGCRRREGRDRVRRSLTAETTEASVLAVIDDKAFLYPVHETPTFALQVIRAMADRIRELDTLS